MFSKHVGCKPHFDLSVKSIVFNIDLLLLDLLLLRLCHLHEKEHWSFPILNPAWIFFQHFRRRAPFVNGRKRESGIQQRGNVGCNGSVLFDNPFSKPLRIVSVCSI